MVHHDYPIPPTSLDTRGVGSLRGSCRFPAATLSVSRYGFLVAIRPGALACVLSGTQVSDLDCSLWSGSVPGHSSIVVCASYSWWRPP